METYLIGTVISLASVTHYCIYFATLSSPLWVLKVKYPAYIQLYMGLVFMIQFLFSGCPMYEIEVLFRRSLGLETSTNQIIFIDIYDLGSLNWLYYFLCLFLAGYFLSSAYRNWYKVASPFDIDKLWIKNRDPLTD